MDTLEQNILFSQLLESPEGTHEQAGSFYFIHMDQKVAVVNR